MRSGKGAIRADAGQPAGPIPGSIAPASYSVDGPRDWVAVILAARRGPNVLALRRPADLDAGAAAAGDGRHRVPRHRRLHRRDPGGVRADRPGDGGCRVARAGSAHAAAGGEHDGGLRGRARLRRVTDAAARACSETGGPWSRSRSALARPLRFDASAGRKIHRGLIRQAACEIWHGGPRVHDASATIAGQAIRSFQWPYIATG